ACMTPAAPETRISLLDPDAVAFRAGIIEGMMLSHPHDCPVCDEGGECHLQDMTVMTGHDYRRAEFQKRTFRNQDLGPFVNHEMNRCIQCYRCVRFYRQYAGGNDLNAFSMANTVFFGRNEDGVLENEFAGNLIEICPTGVFTDRTLRNHYTRKWDLRMAPSICGHCGIGCNVTVGERYGLQRRVVNRFNSEVNGYFLCDRGRFAYEFVNSPDRIRVPQLDGEAISGEAAEWELQNLLSSRDRLIGIGSPRASLEANFALRQRVGTDQFFAGVESKEWELITAMIEILKRSPARTPSLKEIEHSDAVLILGEDVTNSAPRMALSLRQSVRQQPMEIARKLRVPLWMDDAVREVVQDQRGPLFISAPFATRLDDVAAITYRAAPDDAARLGFAVAHEIDANAPEVPGLHEEVHAIARVIADALTKAKRPLIVSGPSCRSLAVVESAANVAKALCDSGRPAALSLLTPECNSFGLALLGARPLEEAVALTGKDRTVIVLENDLYRRLPSEKADKLFGSAARVIALDHLSNTTTARASLLLPAATIAESDGTLVSNEGRAQRYFSVFPHQAEVCESWRWLRQPQWSSLDDVLTDLAKDAPQLAAVVNAAPSSKFRTAGARIPREPHRASGRTATTANLTVVEPKPPVDPDSGLSYTMEGAPLQPPGALQPFFWSPGWNSIQSVNKFQSEIGAALRAGDAGVRLIEPSGVGEYFTQIPIHFARREQEWLVIPIEHIFGSEELSRHAPAIATLAFTPYLALNATDASELGANDETSQIEIELGGAKHRLPVKILPDLPAGVAGVPNGLPAAFGEVFPAWRRIERIS
ncbi:MAG TPA: NADH-quinone oxidoreductase subunit NuoG, partial [Terriglobales bacterium]|nr:NADH-quinone oxidoreductase subunit NuoG [Terriglobales bacterium]